MKIEAKPNMKLMFLFHKNSLEFSWRVKKIRVEWDLSFWIRYRTVSAATNLKVSGKSTFLYTPAGIRAYACIVHQRKKRHSYVHATHLYTPYAQASFIHGCLAKPR
ncbi:hypothetical protein I7I48_00856 [Histoplasma ohiense]|nr:hypothetical protein I7I48_00856 [Histoplasma ohiense (nom. inval.)]